MTAICRGRRSGGISNAASATGDSERIRLIDTAIVRSGRWSGSWLRAASTEAIELHLHDGLGAFRPDADDLDRHAHELFDSLQVALRVVRKRRAIGGVVDLL